MEKKLLENLLAVALVPIGPVCERLKGQSVAIVVQ